MNTGYLIYQAERPWSGAEQRAVDARNGQLAASVARGLHAFVTPLLAVAKGMLAAPTRSGCVVRTSDADVS
jgi:hypothetical protein